MRPRGSAVCLGDLDIELRSLDQYLLLPPHHIM